MLYFPKDEEKMGNLKKCEANHESLVFTRKNWCALGGIFKGVLSATDICSIKLTPKVFKRVFFLIITLSSANGCVFSVGVLAQRVGLACRCKITADAVGVAQTTLKSHKSFLLHVKGSIGKTL